MTTPPPIHVRIFLASPGDVADERALALKALESLAYDDPALRGRIAIEIVAWDKLGNETPMLATMTPQEAISRQRPKPSQCDIVVAVFWSRMGTPLPEEYVKPDGERYLSGTEWEYLDAYSAAQQAGRPAILLYRRTEVPNISLNDPKFDEKKEQWQLVKGFFDACLNADGSIRSGFNEYDSPDTFEKRLVAHLRELLQPLIAEQEARTRSEQTESELAFAPTPQVAAAPLWQGSPFPGLRSFTREDEAIYFGRGREIDGLIGRLAKDARFIIVAGVSGSGKSSLVAAGLLPRLESNAIEGSRDWRSMRFTPGELGENPFIALASGFKETFTKHNRVVRDEAEKLEADPTALDQWVEWLLEDAPHWSKLLLFIDQFEELFTVVKEDFRAPFSELLAHSATLPRLRIVATVRADFYHRCVAQRPLDELLRTGSYPLAAPGIGALHEIIVRPANRAGLSFKPEDLPDRILDDTGKDPGALPLMAFALSELYERRTDNGELTEEAYHVFGGVQGAIGQRATETFETQGADARAALGAVFRELVEVDPAEGGWVATRRRAPFSEVAKTPGAAQLVEAFVKARLLLAGKDEGDDPVVEVAHEALLRNWPRLVDWIEKTGEDLSTLRQLQRAAEEWVAHQGDRWPRRRRRQAETALKRLSKQAEAPIAAFLQASRRRTRLRFSMLGGATAVVALVGWFAAFTMVTANSNLTFAVMAIKERLLYAAGLSERDAWEPDMVTVRPGEGAFPRSFLMGSTTDDSKADDQKPLHEVKFSQPFAIGKYEVTFEEYDYYVERTGARKPTDSAWGRGKRPVMDVSWEEARAYARWLSLMTGKAYRLPSEAEWEYVARAGTTTQYWWGDEIDMSRANCDGCGSQWDDNQTAPVGAFSANDFGLHDTTGNVWEWVEDCWHDSYKSAPYNGSPWLAGDGGNCRARVVRGGSWDSTPDYLRSAYRFGFFTGNRFNNLGFRLAQDL